MNNMRVRIPALILATTVAFSGLLSACGSDDTDKKDSEEQTSQSTEETPEASQDTESEEPDTDESDTDESEDTADGDKPSRDDVIDGYSDIVKENGKQAGMDMPEDVVNQVVTCFVDEVYDDASPKTLQALADADATGIDPGDAKLFTAATTTCSKATS